MSFILNLIRVANGTVVETVPLNDLSTGIVTAYNPKTDVATADQVSEDASVCLLGGLAAAQSKLARIEIFFLQARERANLGAGNRIYAQYSVSSADGYWRSEITDGVASLLEDTIDESQGNQIEVTLSWTRENAWEGEEVQLGLTNGNGSENLTGLTVYTVDDSQSGRDNWVNVNGEDIDGNLPAKLRFEITNTYNNSVRISTFWILQNWRSDPFNFGETFEGELAAYVGASGQILPGTANYASYGGGKYIQSTVLTSGTSSAYAYWTLPGAFLRQCNGNYFKVFGKFLGWGTGTWVKVVVTLAGLTRLYDGPWMQLPDPSLFANNWIELDAIRLPPYSMDVGGTLGDLQLELWAKRPDGTAVMAFDCLQLLAMDGYRKIVPQGYDLGYQATLVVDEINGAIYANWIGELYCYYVSYGSPLRVEPGVDQRFYFLMNNDLLQANPIGDTVSVKLFYRPRRRSL